MTLRLSGIAFAVAFAFATAAQAQTTASDRKAKDMEEDKIEAQAKVDKARCDGLKANAKDICMAEAKGKEKVAKAELDAKYATDRTKAQRKAQDAKAEAAYEVAKQKCDDQKGDAKDACVKQAKAERDQAKGKAQTAEKRDEQRAATGGTAREQPKRNP